MTTFTRLVLFGLVAVAFIVGCTTPETETVLPEGNDVLGVAKFVVQEEPDQTTVVGLDASGGEIGASSGPWLVQFSPPFTEEYERRRSMAASSTSKRLASS